MTCDNGHSVAESPKGNGFESSLPNMNGVENSLPKIATKKSSYHKTIQNTIALEELDSLLLHASRNEAGATVKSMKSNIGIAVDALNSLLKTVPTDILEKGKAIADAYNTPEEDYSSENLDQNLKQLESIL